VDGSDSWGSSVAVAEGSWGSGNSWGSGVAGDSWGSDSGNSWGSLDMMRVGHNWGSLGPLDDWLSLDGNRVWDVVWSINMDGGGDLDNLLGVERSIIRGIVWLLDLDWGLDIVDLLLDLDDWGVDGLGSLQDSWDGDGEMRGSGLQDSGGVSGDVAGLSQVDLLGDNWGGLVDGGDSLSLVSGGVWGGGSWSNIVDGVGHHGTSRVVLRSVGGNWSSGSSYWGSSVADSSWGSHGNISWGTVGASQDKSKCHKRSHYARYLLLS